MSLDVRALYEAEVDAVCAFLGKLGLRGADLEDAAHDTFVTAMARQWTYDASRPVRPWLQGIAFRVMVARARKTSTTSEVLEMPPDRADPSSDPEATLDEKRRLQLVQRAVAELSEEQGFVLVMHDLQGVGAAEISKATGAPLATTYSRLRLARQNFATVVRKLRQPEAP